MTTGSVERQSQRQHQRQLLLARRSSIGAAGLLTALAGFQIALAAGLPLGQAAWGGGRSTLDEPRRIASGVSAIVLGGAALVVLRRGGHQVWTPIPGRWVPSAVWGLTAYASLGTVLNAVSRSTIERVVMTPTALSLAVLCAIVATQGRRTSFE